MNGNLEYKLSKFFAEQTDRLDSFFKEMRGGLSDVSVKELEDNFSRSFKELAHIAKLRLRDVLDVSNFIENVKEEVEHYQNPGIKKSKKIETDDDDDDKGWQKLDCSISKSSKCCKIKPSKPSGCVKIKPGNPSDFKKVETALARSLAEDIEKDRFKDLCDKYCAKIARLISKSDKFPKKSKVAFILAFKLYFFARIFVGPERADKFLDYINTCFSGVWSDFDEVKLTDEISEVTEDFIKENPEFKISESPFLCNSFNIASSMNRYNNDMTRVKVILTGDDFTLQVQSKMRLTKEDSKPELTVTLTRPNCWMMEDSYNVSPNTRLIDMLNFVLTNKEREIR